MNPLPIFTEKLPNGLPFEMIYVAGGQFNMGSTEEGAYEDEQPIHSVEVHHFYIGKHLVTQALWEAVMQHNPAFFPGKNRPVESVSWEDCQTFVQKLNILTSQPYRLPTEAEWEYAARGGAMSKGYRYAGSNRLTEVGWFDKNSHGETKEVGLKFPNELGLYDMNGNVWEWVEDQWHDNYKGAPLDGSAWVDRESGANRVYRGGSWYGTARIAALLFATATPRGIGTAILACAWSCPSSQEVVNPCYPVSQRSS